MPAPAPVSTNTSWPCAAYSRTEPGVSPTRYSWFLISFGQPTRIESSSNPAIACYRMGRIECVCEIVCDNVVASLSVARLPDIFEGIAKNVTRQDRYRHSGDAAEGRPHLQ